MLRKSSVQLVHHLAMMATASGGFDYSCGIVSISQQLSIFDPIKEELPEGQGARTEAAALGSTTLGIAGTSPAAWYHRGLVGA